MRTTQRKVILHPALDVKLTGLADLNEETDGILLYTRHGEICPITGIFMTGVGTAGHVKSAPERIEIAIEFFRANPAYQCAKFHTHSKGTIERFGRHYASHFSPEDTEIMRDQMRADRDFMALLVTPETKLLCGIGRPKLIVEEFPDYAQQNRFVQAGIRAAARHLGYNLVRLRATI
jgi:hypothetical protein